MAARQFSQQTTLLGYVTELYPDEGCFKLRLYSKDNTGHDLIYAYVNKEVWYRPLPNLQGSYDGYGNPDGYDDGKISDKMKKYLDLGVLVLVEGVGYRNHLAHKIEVRTVYLLYDQQGKLITESKGNLLFENPQWWVDMISALGNTWFNAFFADGVDFTRYRTELNELFQPKSKMQEVAVLSRLLYGFAVTYQLTGKDKYLTALREGVKFQRDTFRYAIPGGKHVLWCSYYDGTNAHLPSNNGDDNGTIPLYEQIYALAGLTMYYRITGDLETLKDIFATIDAFDEYFLDKSDYGSYFSHLDPSSMTPDAEVLGINKAKKNWNSVGDHIPAYLINLICALQGKPEFRERLEKLEKMLIEVTEVIIAHFPTPEGTSDKSKLVRERFYHDWTYDDTYSWQQDRGIIGHNLKISWNLTRVAFYLEDGAQEELRKKCLSTANKLAVDMDTIGGVDKFRGGCYDCLERNPTKPGYDLEFTWLSTKDFWQQEQGILCYLIQMATAKLQPQYYFRCRELAAAMSAFYCAFFVDLDRGGIYFRVTDTGVPIMTGIYADKGGHAKSGYHNFENAYLAHIYNAMYNNRSAITLHFAPTAPADGNLQLAISPDFLPRNAIDFTSDNTRVEIVGKGLCEPITHKLHGFTLDVSIPKRLEGTTLSVQVTLQPPIKVTTPMISPPPPAVGRKGKIGVVLESHFDEIEVQYLQERLPKEGYGVELISYLWGNKMLEFQGNECHDPVRVYKDINSVNLDDYAAFFFVGAYCMDRLRYETVRTSDNPNQSPVVQLIRKIAEAKKTTAVICHSLWAFVCAKEVIENMKVTCSHNILDDVVNAGATVMYGGADGGTIETYEDDWLISGKQGGYVAQTTDVLINKLNRENH